MKRFEKMFYISLTLFVAGWLLQNNYLTLSELISSVVFLGVVILMVLGELVE